MSPSAKEGIPDKDATVAAFEGLSFTTASGEVSMKLGKGHQALQPVSCGTFKYAAVCRRGYLRGGMRQPTGRREKR